MSKLVRYIAPIVLAAGTVLTTGASAHAAVNSWCTSTKNACGVAETMGSGACASELVRNGNFVYGVYGNVHTGYGCIFWIERNVNNTGWYDESGQLNIANNAPQYTTGNYWDGPGYQAELCFQFDWGSSVGAAHCTEAM